MTLEIKDKDPAMKNRFVSTTVLIISFALICVPAFGKPKIVKVKVHVDSQAPGFEGFKAMDGNPASMWHTRWLAGQS